MDGYFALFLRTGNPMLYLRSKREGAHAGEARNQGPRAAGDADQGGG